MLLLRGGLIGCIILLSFSLSCCLFLSQLLLHCCFQLLPLLFSTCFLFLSFPLLGCNSRSLLILSLFKLLLIPLPLLGLRSFLLSSLFSSSPLLFLLGHLEGLHGLLTGFFFCLLDCTVQLILHLTLHLNFLVSRDSLKFFFHRFSDSCFGLQAILLCFRLKFLFLDLGLLKLRFLQSSLLLQLHEL